jgi:hypothetical protein
MKNHETLPQIQMKIKLAFVSVGDFCFGKGFPHSGSPKVILCRQQIISSEKLRNLTTKLIDKYWSFYFWQKKPTV